MQLEAVQQDQMPSVPGKVLFLGRCHVSSSHFKRADKLGGFTRRHHGHFNTFLFGDPEQLSLVFACVLRRVHHGHEVVVLLNRHPHDVLARVTDDTVSVFPPLYEVVECDERQSEAFVS